MTNKALKYGLILGGGGLAAWGLTKLAKYKDTADNILQTNKQGSFYGKKKWEHLCDVVLRFEDGIVNVDRNRFGKVGEYKV